MRRPGQLLIIATAPALLSGCGASLRTTPLAQEEAPGTLVDGIPFRSAERLQVEVWRKTDNGYQRVGQQLVTLADPSRLSVMNYRGQPLSDSSLKIEQRADGTLSAVHLTGASKLADELTNVSTGIDAVQAAHTAQVTSKTTADATADQNALNVETTKDEAERLELVRQELPSTAKASDVKAADEAVSVAKIKANQAAVAVGLPLPYP